jgi:hypothetical protein
MFKLTSLALASALTLGAAAGLVHAQSDNDAPSAPPARADAQDCGPDGMGDGCRMGPQDGDRDGMDWGHRRDKHARWGDRDGHGRDGYGHHGGGRMMRIIDANADGVINDDEAASLADFAFMRMDRDSDGALSETEFTEARGPGRRDGGWFRWLARDEAEAVLKLRKDKFVSLDADKNASLSKMEFFADAKAKLAAADTDKDGKVTPWEFRASIDPMK